MDNFAMRRLIIEISLHGGGIADGWSIYDSLVFHLDTFHIVDVVRDIEISTILINFPHWL
jgi:hypothetical protein